MIPHLCFYQLVLITLVWLFITLYLIWPCHRRAKGLQALTSATPSRKHLREPKPFERDLFELGYATHLNRGAGLYLGL
jgi:hypothetical protein